jgi:hypothetical protein
MIDPNILSKVNVLKKLIFNQCQIKNERIIIVIKDLLELFYIRH